MMLRTQLVVLAATAAVISAPMGLAIPNGASAKTMKTTMTKKKKTTPAPSATENKQTPTGGQPGGAAGRN